MKKLYPMKRIAAGCMALCIAFAAFGFSDGSVRDIASADNDSYSSQLEDLKKQQQELDKQIADADKKLADEQDNLEAIKKKYKSIQKKIKNSEKYSAELEDQMAELDGKQLDTQHSLELQETAIDEGKDDFMERIRAMYVAGGANSYTNVLINSSDFYDVLMRIELVTRVAKHDNDELEDLLAQYRELEKTKAELDEQIKQLKAKADEYAKEQKSLADEQAELLKMEQESGELIEKIKNDKSDLEDKSQQVDNKYSEVSSKAATTTTTTTTTAKTTKKADSTKAATTTKKSGESGEKTTTTKKSTQNEKPDNTTAETTTTPQTTTTAKATEPPKTTTTTAAPAPVPDSSDSSKIDTVVSYAKSMVGGAYIWGGSQFGATDCSGLVMLSFAQVGIKLPHYAASQATYGTTVSYANMKKGDVIFFGGASISSIYHVAIYIGDGKMVHAQNSATGIVISNVEYFSRYNNITIIKRLI
ncbi:C40 family peptidase [uncultured Ruminococcus sp.]|uniref:C40 family peptidase n=1 Tax=uncultured Ruminococcus sp. TaxID=165186 RepID=UPI002622886D|nr:C40 family peptidase [uncultured Ruminococcus sp.]